MTSDKAIQSYFESFMAQQLPTRTAAAVFPITSVPTDAVFPFLTYNYVENGFCDGECAQTVELWFRSTEEATPNAYVRAFRSYIETNDQIPFDGGYIWVKPGSPFAQSLKDEADANIKRRYINVTLEYLSTR